MGSTIGQFEYSIATMKKGDSLPFDPQVHIELKHWGTNGDIPVCSPTLMSEAEIDEQINFMKQDLDAVGKRAKAALVRAKEQTKAIVSARSPD
jgi:hypothetical protein